MASSTFDNASIFITPSGYKASFLYPTKPLGTADFDVTRATTAYRTNSSGILESVASGVPRLDYPIGGGCPSLLVEPAATNLLLRSEEFDVSPWAHLLAEVTVTANAGVAPNGTMTADKVTFVSGNTRLSQVITLAASTQYTLSFYCFNLSATSLSVSIGTNTVNSGQNVFSQIALNQWRRVSVTFTTTADTPAPRGIQITRDGNIGGEVLIWGAQLETGSVATSYIPTVAATATRNADVISKTGVSGFIGQTEGSIYVEAFIPKVANNFVIGISDGAFLGEAIYLQVQSNLNLAVRIRSTSLITDLTITAANWSAGLNKVAASYGLGTNNCAISINGGNAITATATAIPTCESIVLGSRPDAPGGLSINDRIRAAAVYTTRLSNTELAALTTL